MKELRFFHLTGVRSRALVPPPELRPALFARFHDLAALRYDYPLVLVEGEDTFARTLSSVVDELLGTIAARGPAGERMRRSVLRLEREIRVLMAQGESGPLSSLWARAAERVTVRGGAPVASDLAQARSALAVDGELVDCDARCATRVVAHAWRRAEERRTRAMRRHIDALVVRLADLLRADHLRSRTGRTAAALGAGIGAPHHALFDFSTMAALLAKPSGASGLSEDRRARIESALAALREQRFFVAGGGYEFVFARADLALAAFRARLPALAALVKAIAVAELEADGAYDEGAHDEYFRAFDERRVGPDDLARFPSYLVLLERAAGDASGRAQVLEALASGAPLKILVLTDDLLDLSSPGDVSLALGAHLATTATGLNDVFVLQAASSHLYRVRERLAAALSAPAAALLSIFTGALAGSSVAPYMVAAAATESRAFPSFAYDPGKRDDGTSGFSLDGDPQPERTWPVHDLAYAGGEMQRVTEHLPFTLVDFAVADPHVAAHFARAPREAASAELIGAGAWLEEAGDWRTALPCVYAVDAESRLHRLVADERLARTARRSARAWLRLRDLARPRKADPAPSEAVTAPTADAVVAPPPVASAAETIAAASEDATASAPPGEAYIETARCTTCNECVELNGAMFAYNENKQAYIKDPTAGPYRTLVEAAEGCQVAIIHPGTPRDPNEPGLEDLLKRAEAFS